MNAAARSSERHRDGDSILGNDVAPTSALPSFWPVLLTLTAVALALRLAFRIDYAEEVDSIRFLLALDDFDVAAHRPHFPGYPVFVLLGRCFYWFFGNAIEALATLCALCGGLLALPVGLFGRALLGPRVGLWAAALVAANPLLWLYSTKLLSDMPGLFLLFCSLAALAIGLRRGGERALRISLLLFGLTLGARLSYFPFLLSAVVLVYWQGRGAPLKTTVEPVLFAGAGIAIWALPMLVVTGAARLLAVGSMQTGGHLVRWGGTIATDSSVLDRLGALAWQLIAHGLGSWWPGRSVWLCLPTVAVVVLVALAIYRLGPTRRQSLKLWCVLTLPYLVWVFLGQNILRKPRHLLPLVVFVLLWLAAAVARCFESRHKGLVGLAAVCTLVLFCGQLVTGATLAYEHKSVPSNAVRLAQHLGRMCSAGSSAVVYTASLQRHLERHAPCVEVVRVRRISQAKRELAGRRVAPASAYVVSDVSRTDRLRRPPVLLLVRNRYVHSAQRELSLFLLEGGG